MGCLGRSTIRNPKSQTLSPKFGTLSLIYTRGIHPQTLRRPWQLEAMNNKLRAGTLTLCTFHVKVFGLWGTGVGVRVNEVEAKLANAFAPAFSALSRIAHLNPQIFAGNQRSTGNPTLHHTMKVSSLGALSDVLGLKRITPPVVH